MSVEEVNVDEPNASEQAESPLTHFFAASWRNTKLSIDRHPEHFETLSEVDVILNVLTAFSDESRERVARSMLIQTHGALRAASLLALSGQVAESYSLMRTALRSAMHGVFIAGDEERQRIWLARVDDDRSADLKRTTFANGLMLRHLRQLDAATAGIYERLHHRTIDRGLHANCHGGGSENDAGSSAESGCDDFALDDEVQRSALRSVAQVGICTLSMFYYVYGDLFRKHKLDDRLASLRHGH